MNIKFHEFLLMVFLVVVIPGWLYASGNLPSCIPCNEGTVLAVWNYFPRISEATYENTRMVYDLFRDIGVKIPCTHNERALRIKTIRLKTIEICDQILLDLRG